MDKKLTPLKFVLHVLNWLIYGMFCSRTYEDPRRQGVNVKKTKKLIRLSKLKKKILWILTTVYTAEIFRGKYNA